MALNAPDLTAAMQEAVKLEWEKDKETEMTDAALKDMRLIFAAVARGLLDYLEDHQDEFITTITFEDVSGEPVRHTVSGTDLDIVKSS